MKLLSLHKSLRPREKLIKYGPGKLSNSELLAILLRTGQKGINVVELAENILKKFSGAKLPLANVTELSKTHGLGPAKACEIVACFELGKRLLKDKPTTLVLSPQDVYNELRDIRDHKKEHFVVFYLNTHNEQIERATISIGTLNASLTHPREVFEPAIKHNAASILIAHNHPSGNTEPSPEDVEVTKRLVEAGNLLGIEVLDHVVVSKSGFTSFKESGLL